MKFHFKLFLILSFSLFANQSYAGFCSKAVGKITSSYRAAIKSQKAQKLESSSVFYGITKEVLGKKRVATQKYLSFLEDSGQSVPAMEIIARIEKRNEKIAAKALKKKNLTDNPIPRVDINPIFSNFYGSRITRFELEVLATSLVELQPTKQFMIMRNTKEFKSEEVLSREAAIRMEQQKIKVKLIEFFKRHNIRIYNGTWDAIRYQLSKVKLGAQLAATSTVAALSPFWFYVVDTWITSNPIEAGFFYLLPLVETYVLEKSTASYRQYSEEEIKIYENKGEAAFYDHIKKKFPVANRVDRGIHYISKSMSAMISVAIAAVGGVATYAITDWALQKEISDHYYEALESNSAYHLLVIKDPKQIDSLEEIEQVGATELYYDFKDKFIAANSKAPDFTKEDDLRRWYENAAPILNSSLEASMFFEYQQNFFGKFGRYPDKYSDEDMKDFPNFLNQRSFFAN